MKDGINVFSAFDGMGCLAISLQDMGIKIDNIINDI